jgi:UDP-perosamine 4-acetyltransferase
MRFRVAHIVESADRRRFDSPPVFVAGTGSYAAEIAEYAQASEMRVEALIELLDLERVGTTIHGLPVIDSAALPAGIPHAVLAAGKNRSSTWAELAANGWIAVTVIHPSAVVSPSAQIKAGCIVGPTAVIGAQTLLNQQTLIGRGALIGHHVSIGEGAVVNPGANVAGNVSIGDGAVIGMGAVVVNGIEIGNGAVVAAGAVVVRDVPSAARVQGVPAKVFADAPLAG